MKQVEILYSLLDKIVSDLNASPTFQLTLHQQDVVKKHMSVSGANGRLWVSPSKGGYDISLSGLSLENALTGALISYFGREADGYKQKNSNKGFNRQPFWRTRDFNDVKIVCEMYARTEK